jgi:hypothetical protein
MPSIDRGQSTSDLCAAFPGRAGRQLAVSNAVRPKEKGRMVNPALACYFRLLSKPAVIRLY